MSEFSKKGFTLVELLMVMAAIQLLAAVLFPLLSGAITTGRERALAACARSVIAAQVAYSGQGESYADSPDDLPAGALSSCKGHQVGGVPVTQGFRFLVKSEITGRVLLVTERGYFDYFYANVSGSFEGEQTSWNSNGGQYWVLGGTMSPSTTYARSGEQSVRITGSPVTWSGLRANKVANLNPGRTYTVSVYVYIPSGQPFSGSFRLYAQTADAVSFCSTLCYDYTLLASDVVINATTPKDQWVRKSIRFKTKNPLNPNANTLRMAVSSSTASSGELYLDDLRVDEEPDYVGQ